MLQPGCRGVTKHLDWIFHDDFDITIPGRAEKEFKKIAANKATETIKGFCNKAEVGGCKMIVIKGKDFEYYSRLLSGDYIDIDKVMKQTQTTDFFRVNAEELFAISKEYEKILGKNVLKQGVYFVNKNNNLVSLLETPDYSQSDIINIKGSTELREDMLILFNPKYLKEGMEVFAGEIVDIKYSGTIHPWLIENGDYKVILLPQHAKQSIGEVRNKAIAC